MTGMDFSRKENDARAQLQDSQYTFLKPPYLWLSSAIGKMVNK